LSRGKGRLAGRRRGARVLVAAALLAATACQTPQPPLRVVGELDLDRYLGRWYEIASFPQRFQAGCVATTADYSRREDGRIRVENECRDRTLDGELRHATGVAWVVDKEVPAKLAVQFFWPFWGSYWVIELDPHYRWAVVGHPSREYLWILSRSPAIDRALYLDLLARIRAQGYDTTRLQWTPQPGGPAGSPLPVGGSGPP
jgi:apolipoprotein D and lipocalin family protein